MGKWVKVKKEKLICRNLGDLFLVYDYARGVAVELNESAKFIWECLDNSSTEDVVIKFAEYCGIDRKTDAEDVYMVLNELEASGFIKRGEDK
jgi:hypothetical protein